MMDLSVARRVQQHPIVRCVTAAMRSPDLVMAASTSLGGDFDIHLNERETFMDVEGWTIEPAG